MLLSSGVWSRRRGAIMTNQGVTVLTGTLESLVEDYRGWLVAECGLAPNTISYYVSAARLFLSEHDERDLQSLTLGEVTDEK